MSEGYYNIVITLFLVNNQQPCHNLENLITNNLVTRLLQLCYNVVAMSP